MSNYRINKHFCIFGAGAIGGLIAAKLKYHGYNVSCIARGNSYEKLSENGIKILSSSETIQSKPVVYKINEKIPD